MLYFYEQTIPNLAQRYNKKMTYANKKCTTVKKIKKNT